MIHTRTKPPGDKAMWRRLIVRTHPDARGEHELFIWTSALKEHVLGEAIEGQKHVAVEREDPERIPYDPALGYVGEFCTLTMRALSVGRRAEEPYRSVLALMIDCPASEHGRQAAHQCRGASYKQLAFMGHMLGWSKAHRARCYEIARSIPLSEKHASHLIGRLTYATRQAA